MSLPELESQSASKGSLLLGFEVILNPRRLEAVGFASVKSNSSVLRVRHERHFYGVPRQSIRLDVTGCAIKCAVARLPVTQ